MYTALSALKNRSAGCCHGYVSGFSDKAGSLGLAAGQTTQKFVRVRTAGGCGDCSNSRIFANIGDKYNIMLVGC
jgi:hypothetical protein